MKKLAKIVLVGCGLGLGVPASAATYDFDLLSPGDLNGQDGWVTAKWRTGTDVQVNATHGYDGSQALKSIVAGSGVGGDGSRQSGGNLILPAFTGPDVQVFDFDVIKNWWGTYVLIGYDTNDDGKIIFYGDENEYGVGLSLSGAYGGNFKLWTGDWQEGPLAPAGWSRMRIVMDTAAYSNQGMGCVLYKNPPNAASWQVATGLQEINLNLDTSATDARNPNNWDQVFFHFETDGAGLDNLTFSTVSKPTEITLSNSSIAENSAIDTIVGAFDTPIGNYTYSLVAGIGDTDNESFVINGNNLKTNAVFDYETKNSYSIRVRVDSVDYGACISFEEVFTITIRKPIGNNACIAPLGTNGADSCYQYKTKAWCTANEGKWYPGLSCKADFPTIPLLVTLSDDALNAEVVDNQLQLTLTTSTEDNVAKLFIYCGKEKMEGVLQVKQICDFNSEGSKISGKTYPVCVDEEMPTGTYQCWPASVDYDINCIDCITHYLDKKVEVIVK